MPIFDFPSEIKEEMTISISKNIVEVFDFVAIHFLQNYCKWSPGVDLIEDLSEGQFGLNSQFKHVCHSKQVVSEVTLTVTQFEPPYHFAYTNVKDHYHCYFSFKDVNDLSTHLTFCFHIEEIDLVMRPFVKLLHNAVQDGVQQTVHNIKQLIDHESVQLQEVDSDF